MPAKHWQDGAGEWWPEVDHSAGFKDSEFHPATAREILRRVARGWTMREVAADPEMPSYATLFHWVRTFPEFGEAYRELRAELAAERVAMWEARRRARARAAAKRPRRGGKRSSFTTAKGRAICALLRAGWTMSAINARPDMPSAKVVYRWLKTEPAFRAMAAKARADRLNDLAWERKDTLHAWEPGDVAGFAAMRAEVERLEGEIGRWQPKVWGRKARW